MAWVTPKIDWVSNPTNPVATDMNRIEGNIDFLKTDIETKKGEIVSALVDMNQASTIADSYATLGLKIKSISKDASATIAQVLTGATFYQDGVKKTGTMVNRGNLSSSLAINGSYTIPQGYHAGSGVVSQSITTKSAQTYTPSTTNQTIASGQYLSGTQTISGDADLVANNIINGKTIFGVAGSAPIDGSLFRTGIKTYAENNYGIKVTLPWLANFIYVLTDSDRLVYDSNKTTSAYYQDGSANAFPTNGYVNSTGFEFTGFSRGTGDVYYWFAISYPRAT